MSKELEAKKIEVEKINKQILELIKHRNREVEQIKSIKLKEEESARAAINKDGIRLLIDGINCLVSKATSYDENDSEDLRSRRDAAAVKLMKAAAKSIDPYVKEVYGESYCVKAVYTVSETVDVDDGTVLSAKTKNLRLELGRIDKSEKFANEQHIPGDQNLVNSEEDKKGLVDAWHKLDEVAGAFVERTGKTVDQTRLAGGVLNKEKLRKNFNVVVETILKIWPNCQLRTIGDNANTAEVITAVLAGVKVIGKLVEKYKSKKAS